MTSQATRSSRTAIPRITHRAPAATLTPQNTQSWKKSSRLAPPIPRPM